MDSEDGQVFVKNLAQFIRTHEKALANALLLRRQNLKYGQPSLAAGEASSTHDNGYPNSAPSTSTSNALATALSLGALNFTSQSPKPAKLTLTSHHLFYLLSRIEEMGIPVGPMNVRLENIHAEASPANYVSFLSQSQRSHGRSDRDSIHSVSSVRSVMSGMSSIWSGFGLGPSNSAAKTEKAKAQLLVDLKYLYSAFTKIPCLRLSPDRSARLIKHAEEFPFDTAVPLLAFKNVSALEICDIDFRQFYGWDKMAEQLRSLTVKRANIDDPTDLFINIILDDMDKRRRRSSRAQLPWLAGPSLRPNAVGLPNSLPSSPVIDDKLGQSPKKGLSLPYEPDSLVSQRPKPRTKSASPSRPSNSKVKRSGSGSSNSSIHSIGAFPMGILPVSKWRFLSHLSLADNSLTSMPSSSLAPLSNNLLSLDLSSNLIVEVPEALSILTSLRALNLSNCMIESLHSLRRNSLPAITALNLRANRLVSLAGVEQLLSLERLDLRDNGLQDPTEIARLTGIPDIHEIWVVRNPFVKSHSNYRVQIFNLFRGTPGYSEDIVIDASAPGYGERRQLRDRIIGPEVTPVVRAVSSEPHSILSADIQDNKERSINADGLDLQRPSPQTTQSEFAVGSGRRRKGPRRRIVELAQETSPPNQQPPKGVSQDNTRQISTNPDTDSISLKTKPTLNLPLQVRSDKPSPQQKPPRTTDPISLPRPDVSDKVRSLVSEIQSLNINIQGEAYHGEAYRQKIESLKSEVGSNWLSVLSEENWTQHHIKPESPAFRAPSHGILSSSRTLG